MTQERCDGEEKKDNAGCAGWALLCKRPNWGILVAALSLEDLSLD